MDKIRLAQALVPIADELDERGLEEEATELDEIIQDLVAEAEWDKGMGKEAQAQRPEYNDPTRIQQGQQPQLELNEMAQVSRKIQNIDKNIVALQTKLQQLRSQKSLLLGQAWGAKAGDQYQSSMDQYNINPNKMQYQAPSYKDLYYQ